jgi:hypothetical protein
MGRTDVATSWISRDPTDYAQLATWIESQLEKQGIRPNPASRIPRLIRALRRWETRSEDLAEHTTANIHVVHNAQVDVRMLAKILRFLDVGDPSWRPVIEEVLDGALTPDADAVAKARNTQFELYVAADLADAGAVVTPSEPDLLVTFGSVTFGVACKRPIHEHAFERAMKDANRQVRNSKMYGFIALDISGAIVERGGRVPQPSPWTQIDAIPMAVADIDEHVTRPAFRHLDQQCFGVLSYAFVPITAPGGAHGSWFGCRMTPARGDSHPSMQWIRRLCGAMSAATRRCAPD